MYSLVSTVFNDRDGLEKFFVSMTRQSVIPQEVIITDAGSNDGTWALLQEKVGREDRPWKMIALQEDRCNVARGRDLAIEAASGELIVSTDIGCDWGEDWIKSLVSPLHENGDLELVIGSWAVQKGDLEGPWALTEWALKGEQKLVADADSYSSSRSIAYRKSTWEALGKYPEDLTLAADDAVFHYLIEKAEVQRVGAADMQCYWHRHSALQGFFKEAYRYGLGDGEAGIRGRDVVLIGGRLLLEALCLGLGLLWLIPALPLAPWAGFFLLLVGLTSIGEKVFKMRGAIGRLKGEGIDRPLLRLLRFTYGTKWHWLKGYLQGLRRGRVHCLDCRRRLAEMTPERYQERLKQITEL